MGMEEIELFMAAMRQSQSGTFAGNYLLQRLPDEGRPTAYGAYQISAPNWEKWTRELGLNHAGWSSKNAQDLVAREKMIQLYRRYGDWRLVKIAWLDGTEAADQAFRSGLAPFKADSDELVEGMLEARGSGYGSAATRGKLSVQAAYTPQAEYEVADVSTVPEPLPLTDSEGGEAAAVSPTSPPAAAATPSVPNTTSTADLEYLRTNPMHQTIAVVLQSLSNAIKAGAQNMIDEATVNTDTSVDTTEASVDTTEAEVPDWLDSSKAPA